MSWDPIWEKVFKEQEWGKYPSESLIRFIAKNFCQGKRKNIKILEVGCGTGANLWYMAREGFDVYGVDGSKTALSKAKKRLAEEGLKASLKEADIIKLPYQNNFFDAVVDIECIYSNAEEDAKKILNEIKRVLKVKGLFYSRTLTDKMYIGRLNRRVGYLQYTDISDGPIAGKGFARLSNREGINELYGHFFKIVSVDRLDYTLNNESIKVSEWVIICEKN